MKLRYYADTPNYDDHEQIIDLLYTISDKYGVAVEIERVDNRYGSIQVFPGEIHNNSPEDVYDRDFHYNRTLGSNIDESPSQAFKSGGRHVDINGYVGIIDDGLVWATTHRGDPIGYGPDVDAADTTLGFLDQVANEGLDAIEEKYMNEAEREQAVLEQFLAADVVDGTIRRDVTVGESLLPDSPAHGVDSSVGELVTRTVDALIETSESDWIIQTAKNFEASTFDTALGQVLVRERLYRLDRNNDTDTTLAIVFNTVPWELDVDAVSATVEQLTARVDGPAVHVFVGRDGEFKQVAECINGEVVARTDERSRENVQVPRTRSGHMTESFTITIKQSVFDATGLSEEKYANETFSFESEAAAEEWVADIDAAHSQQGSLILHSAHPNDNSDVDAYLIFDPAAVWTVDE